MNALGSERHFNDAAIDEINGGVCFSKPSDVDRVLAFYKDNKHPHVDERDPKLLEEEVCAGKVFLIEQEGRISGASSSFNYFATPEDQRPSWVEIGATRLVLGGFGLYPFIISSQVLNECLDTPPINYPVANIYADNGKVRKLLGEGTGWDCFGILTDPRLSAAYASKNKVDTAEMDTWAWLRSTPNCLPHQARIVRDAIEKESFMRLKGDQPAVLKLDMSRFSLATPANMIKIDLLAEGDFAYWLEENGAQMGMVEAISELDRIVAGRVQQSEPTEEGHPEDEYPQLDCNPAR